MNDHTNEVDVVFEIQFMISALIHEFELSAIRLEACSMVIAQDAPQLLTLIEEQETRLTNSLLCKEFRELRTHAVAAVGSKDGYDLTSVALRIKHLTDKISKSRGLDQLKSA